jgi:hypothetical protein
VQSKHILTALVLSIAIFATAATSMGIFSNEGAGHFQFMSVRGKQVTIHGKGLYKDMSAEVAPQGIAQDIVTLFVGIPMLLLSLVATQKGSVKGRFLLAGTLGYFLVTYLFYLVMAMYNKLFLAYVFLAGVSFYAFVILLLSFDRAKITQLFSTSVPVRATGRFLIFNAACIALLWLSIVVPPLLDGTIIPLQAAHYTTLIVQGLDLAILLPAAIITGTLFINKKPLGFLLCPVYFIFLSLLMTALTAKLIMMAMSSYNVVPAIFIIPVFNIASIACMLAILKHIHNNPSN